MAWQRGVATLDEAPRGAGRTGSSEAERERPSATLG
uniref:Uncharacterized protein n=1 Tax=Arundo donax TaxID=35708 RepID=A0A0A9ABY5_ARUDO